MEWSGYIVDPPNVLCLVVHRGCGSISSRSYKGMVLTSRPRFADLTICLITPAKTIYLRLSICP